MTLSNLKHNAYIAKDGSKIRRRRDSVIPLGNRANTKDIPGWDIKRMKVYVQARIAREAESRMSKAGAEVLLASARRESPSLSGKLKDAHYIGKSKMDRYFVGNKVKNSIGVGYSAFVHFGTKYMKANPWLYRAVQKSKSKIRRTMIDKLKGKLKAA